MCKYQLPKNVCSDYKGYQQFIDIIKWLKDYNEQEISFDFSHNKWFEANLLAILGAILNMPQNLTNSYRFTNLSSWQRTTFTINRFLTHYGEVGRPGPKPTIMTYQKFQPDQDYEFSEYIKRELLAKRNFPGHTFSVGKKINESIFELFENARTHGRCDNIFTCGQFYPNKTPARIDVTIVDMGKTIKANVNEFLNGNLSGSEAIEWALKYGNTTKTGTNPGGLGLDIIFDFIKLNNGKIQIVSSDGYWEYRRGDIQTAIFNGFFPGTIANIEFNLDDKNYYLMKGEENLNDIF